MQAVEYGSFYVDRTLLIDVWRLIQTAVNTLKNGRIFRGLTCPQWKQSVTDINGEVLCS
jgi:hypothetical protein